MTPEQAIQHVRLHAARVPERHEEEWLLVAGIIERQQAQLLALAEQVRVMRKALNASATAQAADEEENVSFECQMACRIEAETKRINALALTPTAAEAQAKENAEKAAEYDGIVSTHGDPEEEQTLTEVVESLLANMEEGWGRAGENAEKAALLDWLDRKRPSLSFGCSPQYSLGAWGIYWTNEQTKQVEEAEAERLPDALRAAKEAIDE